MRYNPTMRTVIAVFALLLAACAYQNPPGAVTPAPPTPPQVTVANSMIGLAHALNGATDALIACRNQNKCAGSDVTAAENVVAAIATAGKAIDAELASTDAWSVQQQKIVALVVASGASQLKTRVSPATQLVIQSVITLFDNVSLAVGGPTI